MADYTTSTSTRPLNVAWTDDPVQTNVTKVKAVHMEEMRTALEQLNGHAHTVLSVTTGVTNNGVTWTDDPVVADTTKIKAVHVNELKASLDQQDNHRHTYSKSVSDYTYSAFTSYYNPDMSGLADKTANSDKPEATYTELLRTIIEGMAAHTHTVCCECECQCTCTCQCQCTCTCQCTCNSKTT